MSKVNNTDGAADGLKIIRDLADGFSVQAKYSNRVWLALIAAATLAVFPNVAPDGTVKLPFSLGLVGPGTYSVVAFLILTVLMISFCVSYANAHLATRFAHDEIAKLEPESKRIEAKKFYDLLVSSSLARVAPLAQLIRQPRLAAIYYCALKLVAIAVLLVIPLVAILAAYRRLAINTAVTRGVHWLLVVALVVACVAVLQVLYIECRHVCRVTYLYWTGELKQV